MEAKEKWKRLPASRRGALSNYSTIEAAQVMEFQLKYDSFRNVFLLERGRS